MTILVRPSADPYSDRNREVILIRSDAGKLLLRELERYCNSQINGRSFLIAGHRGSGKTTMVTDAIDRLEQKSGELRMRPLPVFLHGPSLLNILPSERRSNALASDRERAMEDAAAGKPAPPGPLPATAAQPDAAPPPAAALNINPPLDADAEQINLASARETEVEKRAQHALAHLILGLHRAVIKEFTRTFRDRLVHGSSPPRGLPRSERAELAAQFEIEIMEDPPAARLREFWSAAAALERGVLFEKPRQDTAQGSSELVALNGICNAHQRISGALSGSSEVKHNAAHGETSSSGFDVKAAEALKPLGVVFAGSVVSAGAAAGSLAAPYGPAIFGLLTALLAGVFLKGTRESSSKRERQFDKKFIPDLSVKTLDRVLPTLLDRLREAGLAPVLIIDELDKIDDLSDRIMSMIDHFKKLMAENVFSCFLTDRSYLETVRLGKRSNAYGKTGSYYSQQLLIAYGPRDFNEYLDKLLYVEPSGASGRSDDLDREALKWVLRHRSQMNALDLTRQIAALRGDRDEIRIPPDGFVRTDISYRIDITLQVAIEVQLCSTEVRGWLQRQPDMCQIVFDALFFLSRQWLSGAAGVDLSAAGRETFAKQLVKRMNLPVRPPDPANPGDAGQPGEIEDESISDDDLKLLSALLKSMVEFLTEANTDSKVRELWDNIRSQPLADQTVIPPQEVIDAMLLGPDSLLVRSPPMTGARSEGDHQRDGDDPGDGGVEPGPGANGGGGGGGGESYLWRYWPSGIRRQLDVVPVEAPPMMSLAAPAASTLQLAESDRHRTEASIDFIERVAANLGELLGPPPQGVSESDFVFDTLGDSCRILKTSPAWPQVQAAVNNLKLVSDGSGNKLTVDKDRRVVDEFAHLLLSSTQPIYTCLLSAAFLAGIASMPETSVRTSLHSALVTMSSGLGFARLDPSNVQLSIESFRNEIQHIIPTSLDAWPAEEPRELADPQLIDDVLRAFDAGRSKQIDPRWTAATAWQSMHQRLIVLAARDGVQPPASFEEILAVLLQTGPTRLINLDIEATPLQGWTNLLGLLLTPKDRDPSEQPPADLIFCALWRLGACSLTPQLQSQVVDRVCALLDAPADLRNYLNAMLEATSTLREQESHQIMLMMRRRGASITTRWRDAPTKGMLMIIDDTHSGDQSAIVKLFEPFFKQRDQAEIAALAIEQPADSQRRAEKLAALVDQPLYIYARPERHMEIPAIVAPSGPDALFDRAAYQQRPDRS